MEPRATFHSYFALALQHRDEFRIRPALRPWFREDLRSYPPIVAFGFPRRDGEEIPLITIGVNPSPVEVSRRHISPEQDSSVQFGEQSTYFERGCSRWFRSAQLIIQALTSGRATYGGVLGGIRNALHLDLSPVVTTPIDHPKRDAADLVRNLKAARDNADDLDEFEQLAHFQSDLDLASDDRLQSARDIRDLLVRGTEEILAPLVRHLILRHGVKGAVILGGLDKARLTPFGTSVRQRLWPDLVWCDLSSGPSSRDSDDELVRAAKSHPLRHRIEGIF